MNFIELTDTNNASVFVNLNRIDRFERGLSGGTVLHLGLMILYVKETPEEILKFINGMSTFTEER